MAKYNEISTTLRESIEADMDNGVKWKVIAEEHGVDIGVIRSVNIYRRKTEGEKGGVIRYWGNHRLTDGLPSPVTTYHASELEKAN